MNDFCSAFITDTAGMYTAMRRRNDRYYINRLVFYVSVGRSVYWYPRNESSTHFGEELPFQMHLESAIYLILDRKRDVILENALEVSEDIEKECQFEQNIKANFRCLFFVHYTPIGFLAIAVYSVILATVLYRSKELKNAPDIAAIAIAEAVERYPNKEIFYSVDFWKVVASASSADVDGLGHVLGRNIDIIERIASLL